jgi:hypothetical protein
LVLALAPANARITEIDVNTATSQSSIYSGQSFGAVGAYRMINGTVKGEVDPHDPLNAVIVDIDLAPRNSRGMVEYSTDFQLLAPMDLSKGNHRILYDVTNRGGANALAILDDGGAQSTSTPGWALRATPPGETGGRVLVDGCDASGQRIPFVATLAARQATGDPRPSLAERYSSHTDYVAKVTAAAQALQAQRLLVDIDVAKYISAANAAAVP